MITRFRDGGTGTVIGIRPAPRGQPDPTLVVHLHAVLGPDVLVPSTAVRQVDRLVHLSYSTVEALSLPRAVPQDPRGHTAG
jgi:hypothetical protein